MTQIPPLVVTIPFELMSGATADLRRYDDVRVRLNLLLSRTSQTSRELVVEFRDPPPPATIEDWSPAQAAAACAWLARVEAAWGRALGLALHVDEPRYDPALRRFAIGPALLRPSGSRAIMVALAAAIDPAVGPARAVAVDSFGDLAADLAADRPELAEALDSGQSDEERVTRLCGRAAQLARGKEKERFEGALAIAERAHRLAPLDIGVAEDLCYYAHRAQQLDQVAGDVWELLRQRGAGRARSLWLLAASRLVEDVQEARGLAERAVEADPRCRDAWRQVAKSARGAGDAVRVGEALETLATEFACEHSLVQLERLDSRAWRRALSEWSGPMSQQVLGWRLEQLAREERHTAVLRLFQEHVALAAELGESSLSLVVEAAGVVPGRFYAVRTVFEEIVAKSAPPSTALLTVYAQMCAKDRQWQKILELEALYPGVLGSGLLLRALHGEGRLEEAFRRFDPSALDDGDSGIVWVDIIVGLAGSEGGLASEGALGEALSAGIVWPEARARAVDVHQQLCETAPTHPAVAILTRGISGRS